MTKETLIRLGHHEEPIVDRRSRTMLAEVICAMIVLSLSVAWALSVLSLLVLDSIPEYTFPIAIVFAAVSVLFIYCLSSKVDKSLVTKAIALAILLLIFVPMLIEQIPDGSFDGLAYHQSAILALEEGWNPIREVVGSSSQGLWAIHYPKASWIIGAVMMKAFGNIEAAKSVNLLFAIAAGLLACSLIREYTPRNIPGIIPILIGIGVTANPVVISQLLSSYTDGLLASLLLLTALFSIQCITQQDTKATVLYFCSVAICANVKFTAVVYLCVGLLVLISVAIIKKRRSIFNVTAIGAAALSFGILVIGFDPYVKNALGYGHIFYPLFGDNPVDIMAYTTPVAFFEMNWIERLLRSLLAAPLTSRETWPSLLSPAILSPFDFQAYGGYDLPVGGFGPIFGVVLMGSILILLAPLTRLSNQPTAYWSLIVFVVVTVALNPEAWWARYVPQLWWFPWIIISANLFDLNKGFRRFIAVGFIVCLGINTAVVGFAMLRNANWYTNNNARILSTLKRKYADSGESAHIYFNEKVGLEHRVRIAGVDFVTIKNEKDLHCENPEELWGGTFVCWQR